MLYHSYNPHGRYLCQYSIIDGYLHKTNWCTNPASRFWYYSDFRMMTLKGVTVLNASPFKCLCEQHGMRKPDKYLHDNNWYVEISKDEAIELEKEVIVFGVMAS